MGSKGDVAGLKYYLARMVQIFTLSSFVYATKEVGPGKLKETVKRSKVNGSCQFDPI